MKKIIGITRDGVVCSDGKTYYIDDFNRKALENNGLTNAYLSQVFGYNTVVIKCSR
jgi:histidinol phosphatase-like enzyme